MKKKILSIIAGIMMMTGAAVPAGAYADSCGDTKFFGMDPWYAELDCDDNGVTQEQFNSDNIGNTILKIVATVIKDLMFFGGMASIVLMAIAGIKYATSAGDPAMLAKAKKSISSTIIGLVICMLSYAVVTFILKVVIA